MSQWDRIAKKGRRPGETTREYACFTAYLNCGPDRSIVKISEETAKKTGKSVAGHRTYWQRLSAKWKWQERCAAYDAEQLRLDRKEMEKRRRALARKIVEYQFSHFETLEKAGIKLVKHLEALLDSPKVDIEQIKPDGTVNRVRAPRQADIAILHKEMRETAKDILLLLPPEPTEKAPRSPSPPKPGSMGGTFSFVKPKPKNKRAKNDSKG